MANIVHWAAAVSGDFSSAANWTGGVVPNTEDDAYLDAAGHRFQVTVTQSAGVNGVDLSANVGDVR